MRMWLQSQSLSKLAIGEIIESTANVIWTQNLFSLNSHDLNGPVDLTE